MQIFFHLLNGLLMIALPVVLGFFLAKRLKVKWRLFGIGAATFVASQVLHLPFNAVVLNPLLGRLQLGPGESFARIVLWATLIGLSAGIFEELARYLVLRYWCKIRTWREGLMFGAGHGGIEAMLLGLLALFGLVQAIALRGVDLASVVPPESLAQVQAQLEAYWAVPWHGALLGALERVSALCFHLALALLVMRSLTSRNPLWLLAAIAWHALVNASVVVVVQYWGAYAAEGAALLLALLSVAYILTSRGQYPSPVTPAAEEPAVEPPPPDPSAAHRSIQRQGLDDSRFLD